MSQLTQKILRKANHERFIRRQAFLDQAVVNSNHNALVYQGLHTMSLSLACIRPGKTHPRVNLVLPELSVSALFAGVKTALDVGFALANQLQIPLRIVVFGAAGSTRANRMVEEVLRPRGRPAGQQVEIVAVSSVNSVNFSESDVWVATYWTTAHALDVACRLGILNSTQIVYLIQDYEPGFMPWSTDHSLATATYSAGFIPLVNSRPLEAYLASAVDMSVPDGHTFRPQLDLVRLAESAQMRKTTPVPKIIFYGRPQKPRNMFQLGVGALRAASLELESQGVNIDIQSMGESHPKVPLPNGKFMVSAGKVAWDEYFRHLSSSPVMFSLQASPHPSHPPLDAVVSGGFAVINEVGDTRANLHDRLVAVPPQTETLAAAIVKSVHDALDRPQKPVFDPGFLTMLGDPLDKSIAVITSALVR